MPDTRLDLTDATELTEMLTFIAEWLASSQRHILADSFAVFMGPHTTYDIDGLQADLHRFTFLLGLNDGEELFGDLT